MMTEQTYTPQQIQSIGGRDWRGTRTYLNDVDELIGLDVAYYRSGNACDAALDGQDISNAEARRLLATKVWLDHATGALMVQVDQWAAPRSLTVEEIAGRVAASVARRVAGL